MAASPVKLSIAMMGLFVVFAAGWLMDLCNQSVATGPDQEFAIVNNDGITTELDVFIEQPDGAKVFIERYKDAGDSRGVFETLWHFSATRFNEAMVPLLKLDTSSFFANITNVFIRAGLCVQAGVWAIRYHTIYSVIFFSITAVVVCITGSAICRCAALEFARGEKPGIIEAVRFGCSKFFSLFAAPLIPIVGMLVFGFLIWLVGLIGNIPWLGELVVGSSLLASLVFGVLFVLMLVGTVAGGCLMLPAIAYEGSTGMDAVSRSIMYVLMRPWWVVVYSLIATVYGAISYLIVRFFAFLLLIVTYNILDIGISNGAEGANKLARIWSKPQFSNLFGAETYAAMNWSEYFSAFLIRLTLLVVVGIVVAFVISYFFCVSTIIYSALRKRVDGTDLDQVYIHLEEIRDDSSED